MRYVAKWRREYALLCRERSVLGCPAFEPSFAHFNKCFESTQEPIKLREFALASLARGQSPYASGRSVWRWDTPLLSSLHLQTPSAADREMLAARLARQLKAARGARRISTTSVRRSDALFVVCARRWPSPQSRSRTAVHVSLAPGHNLQQPKGAPSSLYELVSC